MKLKKVKDFIQAYKNVCNHREDYYYYEPLDQAIFNACRKMQRHTNKNEVFAKIALVNRTYGANFGRYLGRAGKYPEWRLAEKFVRGKIDDLLLPLKSIGHFNRNSIDTIVRTHEKLVTVTYSITKRTENSFCSKYLSFHFPKIIPIFDFYSSDASWNLAGKEVKAARFDENWNCDYGYHCEAVLLLIKALLESGIKDPDLKLIDCVLYGER